MANNLQGLAIAVREQLDRTFNNVTATEKTFLSMIMNLDAFYKRKGSKKSFRSVPLDINEYQINYQLGLPRSQMFDAMNPDLEAHTLPLTKGYNVEGGTIVPASIVVGPEGILKYQINRFKGDAATINWVKDIASAAKESITNTIQAGLFPTSQMAPTTAGGVNGQPSRDRLMAVGYPLQAGGAGNVAGVSGTDHLQLYNIDLNLTQYQGIRAVNAGTNTTPFGNPTPSNLRKKILMPVRRNKGRPDLWLLGSGPYNFMVSTPEDQVRLTQMITMEFGGEYASFPNTNILLEYNLDDLETNSGVAEGYFLDSSEVIFGTEGGMKEFSLIEEVPKAPTLWMMQGYMEAIFFIRNPRRCAHAYGLKY